MAANKTKATPTSVADYIAAIDDPSRRTDAEALAALFTRVTGEPAVLWGPSIVGFGSYHYKYDSGREGDMPKACFSPRKAAFVVYSMGSPETLEMARRLGKHKIDGGCLHIKKLADVDLAVLEEMVRHAASKAGAEGK